MLAQATTLGLDDLANHCQTSIDAEPALRALERAWRAARARGGRPAPDPPTRSKPQETTSRGSRRSSASS